MRNRLFSENMLHIMTSPERWRIVSGRFPPEVEPVCDIRHAEWMAENCQGHSHREVLFALSGEAHYGFKQNVYPCNPGTIFVFDSFEEHDSDYPPWVSDAVHLWMYISKAKIILRVLSVKDGVYRILPGSSALLSSALPAHLFSSPNNAVLPAHIIRFQVFSATVALVTAAIELGYTEEFGSGEEFRDNIIKVVEQHIRQTSGRGVTLDGLARLSGYSKFHLERLFKKHTGYSIHEYVNRCRAEKFRQMKAGRHSMKEISQALGFTCQSSFSRWLKSKNLQDFTL
jgi:AraC-like DNA-binding protein